MEDIKNLEQILEDIEKLNLPADQNRIVIQAIMDTYKFAFKYN